MVFLFLIASTFSCSVFWAANQPMVFATTNNALPSQCHDYYQPLLNYPVTNRTFTIVLVLIIVIKNILAMLPRIRCTWRTALRIHHPRVFAPSNRMLRHSHISGRLPSVWEVSARPSRSYQLQRRTPWPSQVSVLPDSHASFLAHIWGKLTLLSFPSSLE